MTFKILHPGTDIKDLHVTDKQIEKRGHVDLSFISSITNTLTLAVKS